jgi:hypothetical protein
MKNDLPVLGITFKSGSNLLVKDRLKSLRPLNTERKTNSAIALTITPSDAIAEMILMALFLLVVRRYRLAM